MKILGFNYTLKYSETAHDSDSFGRFNIRTQKILIANDLHHEQEISSVLHEIIETLNYLLALSLNHHAIMALDSALFQVLKDSGVDLKPLLRELEAQKHE